MEGNFLQDNDVRSLYIRYLDVDWTPADSAPVPLAHFSYGTSPAGYTIIPVVSIRNRVFEKLNPASIPAFAADILYPRQVYQRVPPPPEPGDPIRLRLDTPDPGKLFFLFARIPPHLSPIHLLRDPDVPAQICGQTGAAPVDYGVPPVDYGVLFYFNLEETDTGNERSVYERAAAHHYTPSLRSYPLTLDVALPLFPYRPGDIRDGEDLFEIITDINRHSNHHIRNLIFFDLNRENLTHYDRNVFREALARFN